MPTRWNRRRVLVAGVAVAAAAALTGYWLSVPEPRPGRVVVISIDTLRADYLGCYGFEGIRTPNIDRLAAEGVSFDNAATTTPLTLPAHASILTGRTPLGHGVRDNYGYRLDESETTLAEVLRSAGLTTAAFVGSFVLDSRWGIGQGFDTYFDDFESPSTGDASDRAHERPGNEVLDRALEWIDTQSPEAPFFLFLHFFDPHAPYAPPSPYRDLYPSDHRGQYAGEIAFVDSLIGKLREELELRNLFEDTLLVLLGDHGESLGDHAEQTHGFFIYDSTMKVPLIVRGPGLPRGARVTAQVRTIDVMPTVLDLLGLETPASVEGESLRLFLENPDLDTGRLAYLESYYAKLHFGWAPLTGLRSRKWKFVDAPRRELYDLDADPGEHENLAAGRSATVATFAQALLGMVPEGKSAAGGAARLDEDTRTRLRALGYLTASVAAAPVGEPLSDPKDKIDVFNAFVAADERALAGDTRGAIELVGAVIAQEPSAILAYLLLGNLELRARAFQEAATAFRAALERDETNADATYGLALARKGLGDLDAAASGFERALELDPGRLRPAVQLAGIHLLQGHPDKAEALLSAFPRERADAALRLALAKARLAQGKRAEALEVLREGAVESPDNALVRLELGKLLLEQGDVPAAIAQLETARSLAPRSAEVWNALGGGLARLGKNEEALEAFRKAVELDPSFAAAFNNLGIALARSGRGAEAERAFKKALEQDPAYAEAYNNLGFLYLQVGAIPEASGLFREALRIDPSYEQARRNLEEALLRKR